MKIIKSEKGSISIYFIIILAVIFFLNAVLIDYARIMTAKKQTESAIRASLRSVMSCYDNSLFNRYGLFALNCHQDEKAVFTSVLKKNLTSDSSFNLVNIEVEDSGISLEQKNQLSYHPMIKRQILEEMKYKAPVNVSIHLIDQFKEISNILKESGKTTNVLKEVKDKFESRQANMKEAIQVQRKAADLIKHFQGISSIQNVVANYDNFIRNKQTLLLKKEELNATSEDDPKHEELAEEIKEIEENIHSYKSMATSAMNTYKKKFEQIADDHQNYLNRVRSNIEEGMRQNKEIMVTIEKNKTTSSDQKVQELNNLREKLYQDVVLEESYFSDFRSELVEQEKLIKQLKGSINQLNSRLFNALHTDSLEAKNDMQKQINNIKHQLAIYQEAYINSNNEIDKRQMEFDELEKKLDKGKQTENEVKSKTNMEAFENLIDKLKEMKDTTAQYQRAETFLNEFTKINTLAQQSAIKPLNNPDVEAESQMNNLGSFLSSVGDLLENQRNKIYINEYGFDRFTYFDMKKLQEFINKNKNTQSKKYDDSLNELDIRTDGLLDLLDINNQEIEYIMYGHHQPSSNLANALLDIFLIRLAIRTAEGFFEPEVKALGHPLLILAGAILYGVTTSVLDMVQIVSGEKVEFTKMLKKTKLFEMSYGDYLYLLFFFHGDEASKLSRIQTLIKLNTNRDLNKMPTYIKANVTGSIKLWFVPGIIKSLNYVGILDGEIEKGYYKYKKSIVYSY